MTSPMDGSFEQHGRFVEKHAKCDKLPPPKSFLYTTPSPLSASNEQRDIRIRQSSLHQTGLVVDLVPR